LPRPPAWRGWVGCSRVRPGAFWMRAVPVCGGRVGAQAGPRRWSRCNLSPLEPLSLLNVPGPRTNWTRRVPHPVLIGHAAASAAGHCHQQRGRARRLPDAGIPLHRRPIMICRVALSCHRTRRGGRGSGGGGGGERQPGPCPSASYRAPRRLFLTLPRRCRPLARRSSNRWAACRWAACRWGTPCRWAACRWRPFPRIELCATRRWLRAAQTVARC